jgi:hypothetical protein
MRDTKLARLLAYVTGLVNQELLTTAIGRRHHSVILDLNIPTLSCRAGQQTQARSERVASAKEACGNDGLP